MKATCERLQGLYGRAQHEIAMDANVLFAPV
jgi:hypothetical protein